MFLLFSSEWFCSCCCCLKGTIRRVGVWWEEQLLISTVLFCFKIEVCLGPVNAQVSVGGGETLTIQYQPVFFFPFWSLSITCMVEQQAMRTGGWERRSVKHWWYPSLTQKTTLHICMSDGWKRMLRPKSNMLNPEQWDTMESCHWNGCCPPWEGLLLTVEEAHFNSR